MFAKGSAFVRDEVSTSPPMFFQVDFVTEDATTEAVENKVRIFRHNSQARYGKLMFI